MDEEAGQGFNPSFRPFLLADSHWLADTSYPHPGKTSVKEGMSKLISCWYLSYRGWRKCDLVLLKMNAALYF